MIVVDASALLPTLADDGPDGEYARHRLRGEELAAPELIDIEVLSALRRSVLLRTLTDERALRALGLLADLPIRRSPHRPLLPTSWSLRHNLSAYDACYVALAKLLSTSLLTADGRLARSPGLPVVVELLSSHRQE